MSHRVLSDFNNAKKHWIFIAKFPLSRLAIYLPYLCVCVWFHYTQRNRPPKPMWTYQIKIEEVANRRVCVKEWATMISDDDDGLYEMRAEKCFQFSVQSFWFNENICAKIFIPLFILSRNLSMALNTFHRPLLRIVLPFLACSHARTRQSCTANSPKVFSLTICWRLLIDTRFLRLRLMATTVAVAHFHYRNCGCCFCPLMLLLFWCGARVYFIHTFSSTFIHIRLLLNVE